MSAPLSVVIPTLNAAETLGPTLAAVAEPLMEGLIREVILADGGSEDDTAAIAEATGADMVAAPRGRGPQLSAGCAAAGGEWLLVLHADTMLPEGWAEVVRQHMRAHPDRAGWFRLRFDRGGVMARVVAGWANLRSRLCALPYGDQGLLIRRGLYERAGGYEEIPLMEDVALVRRIGRRRLRGLPATVTTSAARYARDGWLRRGWRNLTTLALYFMGRAPEKLAARYERGR